jgi:hypothetical protein
LHEREKLREAKYFYSKMIEEQLNVEYFKHNLSAFLSSARSVLQYALNEAQIKKRQSWYDKCISNSIILTFFKEKRDINIHVEPIIPKAQHKLEYTLSLSPSLLTTLSVKDADGNIIQQSFSDEPESKSKESAVQEIRYTVADWKGSEDVLTICHKYIQELEHVVSDGVRKGVITG